MPNNNELEKKVAEFALNNSNGSSQPLLNPQGITPPSGSELKGIMSITSLRNKNNVQHVEYLQRNGAYWKDDAGIVYKLTEDGKKIKKLEGKGASANWADTNLDVATTLAGIDETKIGYCPPITRGGARKSRRHRKHSKKQRKHRKTRKA